MRPIARLTSGKSSECGCPDCPLYSVAAWLVDREVGVGGSHSGLRLGSILVRGDGGLQILQAVARPLLQAFPAGENVGLVDLVGPVRAGNFLDVDRDRAFRIVQYAHERLGQRFGELCLLRFTLAGPKLDDDMGHASSPDNGARILSRFRRPHDRAAPGLPAEMTPASSAGSTGLTRCRSKPASSARWRCSGAP